MFHHNVMFRFKEGTTQDQIDAITSGLATLPNQIDVLLGYRFGPDVAITDGSWDYGVTADFARASHYGDYSMHPAHLGVVQEYVSPVVDEVARVQFTT